MALECCPYCSERINLYESWMHLHQYTQNFEECCPKCEKIFEVDVEAMPEFVFYKKENV